MYAIKLKSTGGLVRRTDDTVYTFETPQQAEEMAKLCYSERMCEVVNVEAGSECQTESSKNQYVQATP